MSCYKGYKRYSLQRLLDTITTNPRIQIGSYKNNTIFLSTGQLFTVFSSRLTPKNLRKIRLINTKLKKINPKVFITASINYKQIIKQILDLLFKDVSVDMIEINIMYCKYYLPNCPINSADIYIFNPDQMQPNVMIELIQSALNSQTRNIKFTVLPHYNFELFMQTLPEFYNNYETTQENFSFTITR